MLECGEVCQATYSKVDVTNQRPPHSWSSPMSSSRRIIAICLSLAFVAPSLVAQANTLVGRWDIEYERGRRMENGEVTPIMGKALLSIEQRGDSLRATLQPAAGEDGVTPPPQQLTGALTSAGGRFTAKGTARLNMNGEIVEKEVTSTWTLAATSAVLSGTMSRVIKESDFTSEPTPVKGTRRSP
jgi:hypothetical protein